MSDWYLIHTKIRQECVALANLERQHFECFLPLLWVEKLRRGQLQTMQEALFPRYLFIRLGTGLGAQSWAPIRSTLGVSRLVMFGQTPARIDDALVADIRSRMQSNQEPLRFFAPGEQVRIAQGAFAGLEAIYQMPDGEGRVMVLLNLLHKPVTMLTSPANLRKIG